MKPKYLMILLVAFALVDDLIALVFKVDFQFQSYSFIPHCCFVSLMLSIYDRDWLDRILICGLCGLMIDMFIANSFLENFVLYMFLGLIIGLFSKSMDADARIRFLVSLVMVFLVDFIPVVVRMMLGLLQVSLWTWFIHHELLSLVCHAVIIFVLMYCLDVFKRFQKIRWHRRQLQEKRKYIKLKSYSRKRQVI